MPIRGEFEDGLSAASNQVSTLAEAVDITIEKELAKNDNSHFFVAFISSYDPVAKQSWCSDVRASMPKIQAAFAGDEKPNLFFIHVGQRPEYVYLKHPKGGLMLSISFKATSCIWRTKWNIHFVPTIICFERIDRELRETGRLVEAEVLDEQKLKAFVK